MGKKGKIGVASAVALTVALNVNVMASSFSDMPSNWSKPGLEKAVSNGLLNGYDGKIMPNKNLTRAEMATIVSNMLGLKDKANIGSFSDVNSGKWYYESMAKAVEAEIFKGAGGGLLKPESTISRQETFVIMSRILMIDSNSNSAGKFSDSSEVASWAKSGVNALIDSNYIEGSGNKLNPKANITRAEFAKILSNIGETFIKENQDNLSVQGNAIVNNPNVNELKGNIKGDLILAEGFENSTLTLDSVDLSGRIVVRGGKKLVLRNSRNIPEILITNRVKDFEIVIEKDSTVDKITAYTKVEITGAGKVNEIDLKDGAGNSKVDVDYEKINTGGKAPEKEETEKTNPEETPKTSDRDKKGSGGSKGGSSSGGGSTVVKYGELEASKENIVQVGNEKITVTTDKDINVLSVKDNQGKNLVKIPNRNNTEINGRTIAQSDFDKIKNKISENILDLAFANIKANYKVEDLEKQDENIKTIKAIVEKEILNKVNLNEHFKDIVTKLEKTENKKELKLILSLEGKSKSKQLILSDEELKETQLKEAVREIVDYNGMATLF